MTVKHIDRRIGSAARSAEPKQTGHAGEKLSEFFDFNRWPEKMVKKVTRAELLAILDRWHRVNNEQKWYRRLGRWLKAAVGSGPVVIGAVSKPSDEPVNDGAAAEEPE